MLERRSNKNLRPSHMTICTTLRLGFTTIAISLLSACAAPTQTTLDDGTMALLIDCGGTTRGMNYCFEKAGKSCGADGYSIVGQDGQVIATDKAADTDPAAVVRNFDAETNNILVKCGS